MTLADDPPASSLRRDGRATPARWRPAAPPDAEGRLTSPPTRPLRELPAGVAVGLLSGLFGIGGGVLAVPALLWLGFAQHAAHATSLAAIVLTACAAVVPFWLDGAVHPVAALLLVVGSLVGVSAGAGLMHRTPARALRGVFGVFILVVAVRMLVGIDPGTGGHVPDLDALRLVLLAGVGLVTGVLSALLGVGGGLVLVPALALFFDFSQHAAEGTSLAVIAPTALLGAARHARRGYTQWRTGLTMGLGGILGGLVGATLALSLEGPLLQRLFAVFLAAMAIRLVTATGGDDRA